MAVLSGSLGVVCDILLDTTVGLRSSEDSGETAAAGSLLYFNGVRLSQRMDDVTSRLLTDFLRVALYLVAEFDDPPSIFSGFPGIRLDVLVFPKAVTDGLCNPVSGIGRSLYPRGPVLDGGKEAVLIEIHKRHMNSLGRISLHRRLLRRV